MNILKSAEMPVQSQNHFWALVQKPIQTTVKASRLLKARSIYNKLLRLIFQTLSRNFNEIKNKTFSKVNFKLTFLTLLKFIQIFSKRLKMYYT